MLRRWKVPISIALLLFSLSASPTEKQNDLSVAWIQRLPKIPYVWNSSNPRVEGWPAPGETVTWVANVRNLGSRKLTSVGYRWKLDKAIISSGAADLPPNRITQFSFAWKWKRKRHTLTFEIDPGNSIAESEERNNQLLVYTDALGVGFWVEKKFWRAMQNVVSAAGIGCTTFDDWMQRRIRQFNEMAALAKYPETPRGVLDRWRIDEIHVVPNGALPVNPVGPEVRNWGANPESYSTLYPDSKDFTIDMEWGFPAKFTDFYLDRDAWTLMYDSLVHELGHARYLVDVYPWNVSLRDDQIGISPPPPATQFGFLHFTPENGLMNTSWGYIDCYSAVALNQIAGRRATVGHYNEPSNVGAYLNDLPESNRIRIVTPDGNIFPNRKVRIYQASGAKDPDWLSHPVQLKIDGRADLEFTTDAQGTFLLGRNPFSNEPIVLNVDQNNALAIVELVDDGKSHWGYLESREFNLAYWRGNTNYAQYQLVVDAPVCEGGNGLGPVDVTPYHETVVHSGDIDFKWPVISPTIPQYELWYSVDGKDAKHRIVQSAAGSGYVSTTIHIKGKRVAWWLVYQDPFLPSECPLVRSSTYFFDVSHPSTES